MHFNPQLFKFSIIETKMFDPLDFELSRFHCICVLIADNDPGEIIVEWFRINESKKQLQKRYYSMTNCIYNRLSLSRNLRDSTKHFEISVLRHIRFAELRKLFEQPP